MEEEEPVWNVDLEVNLFHAMRKHKPVGINRYFQMACIYDKLNTTISKPKLSSGQIWKHLGEMYDLQALNESEIIPFPNKELDFLLPDSEYKNVMAQDFPRISKDKPTSLPPEETGTDTKDEGKDTKDQTKDTKDNVKDKDHGKDAKEHAKDVKEHAKDTKDHAKDPKDHAKDAKDHGKDTAKEQNTPKESSSKSKVSSVKKTADRLADAMKSDDSPKRDERKRTRHTASPAVPENTPSTTKRARRI